MSADTSIKRTVHRLIRLAVAAGVVLTMLAQQQRPAEAGVWAFGHGWAGETTLHGLGHARAGMVEGLWESILVAHYGQGWIQQDEWWQGTNETWLTSVFQRDHGVTDDGIVGPQTWAAVRWFYVRPTQVVDGWEYFYYAGPAWVNGRGFRHALRRNIAWDNWQVGWDAACTIGAWSNINHDYSQFPWRNPGCLGD